MPASAGAVRARVGEVNAEANKLKKYLESNPDLKAVDGDVWYRLTDGSFARGFDKKRTLSLKTHVFFHGGNRSK